MVYATILVLEPSGEHGTSTSVRKRSGENLTELLDHLKQLSVEFDAEKERYGSWAPTIEQIIIN